MFSGEQIIMQKEKLQKDVRFLLLNGAVPITHRSFDIPLINRESSRRDVRDAAEGIFEDMLDHVDIRIPHQVYYTYRRRWESSDARTIMTTFDELCENLHTQVKAYDVSREMFAFRVNIFPSLLPWAVHRKKVLVADISSGISTRLGDGQRFHDGEKWSFSQMKGLRTHTGHIYIRGIST